LPTAPPTPTAPANEPPPVPARQSVPPPVPARPNLVSTLSGSTVSLPAAHTTDSPSMRPPVPRRNAPVAAPRTSVLPGPSTPRPAVQSPSSNTAQSIPTNNGGQPAAGITDLFSFIFYLILFTQLACCFYHYSVGLFPSSNIFCCHLHLDLPTLFC